MVDDVDRPAPALDNDIYAERDVWAIRDSYNTYVNQGQTADELQCALINNRSQLEPLREKFARAVYEEGGIKAPASRRRKTYFKELNRIYSASEAIKDELRKRGASFEIDEFDEEHPNSAYRRYAKKWGDEKRAQSPCYVVTTIYGERSRELLQVRRVCRWRFALNPWTLPSWILYKAVGPRLARFAKQNTRISRYLNYLLAAPIVRASSISLRMALPWILYLGLFGWCPLLIAAAWLLLS